jgi:hypothetical protein
MVAISPVFYQYCCECFQKVGLTPHPDQMHAAMEMLHRKRFKFVSCRGFGKTLLLTIIETFLAKRGWRVCHLAKLEMQLTQWQVWMAKLGWKTTKYNARFANVQIDCRLYCQGRGPRYDVLCCDEVGTVITPKEQKDFFAVMNTKSGSVLNKLIITGTNDPNSVLNVYKGLLMPIDPTYGWAWEHYEEAVKTMPAWFVDQEFRCLNTPAGGVVLPNCMVDEHDKQPTRGGIDVNSEAGITVVESCKEGNDIYICNVKRFTKMEIPQLAAYIKSQPFKYELETNGEGKIVEAWLKQQGASVIADWVTEESKIDRISKIVCCRLHFSLKTRLVMKDCMRQVWTPEKKIYKFPDAHYFDAMWHSVRTKVSCGFT